MPKIGIHVAKISHVLRGTLKKRKTMLEAIQKDCKELKIDACQIFVQGPRNSKMSTMDYGAINKYCVEQNINLYVHSSYITVGIFSVNEDNKVTTKSQNAIKSVTTQLDACDKLGAGGLVIHISKRTPQQIVDTFKVLAPIVKHFKTPILLEQPAKRPDDNLTYETPEKINNLTKLMKKELPKVNWGWCFDTAHLFSAGVEIDIPKVMRNWFDNLQYPEMVKLFHLNGLSIKDFNTGKDEHRVVFGFDDDIFGDDVWDDDKQIFEMTKIKKSSIYIMSKFAKKYNVDSILEINRGNYQDMMFAIDHIKKLFT